MLQVKDIPGGLTVAQMREEFEDAIRNSKHFASNTPLAPVIVNDHSATT